MGKRKLTLKCYFDIWTNPNPCRGTLDDFLHYFEGEQKKSLKPPNYMLKVYGNKSKHPRHTNYNMSSHHYIAVHIDPRGPLWKGPRPNILLSDCASTIWECGNTAMNEPRRKKTNRFKYWAPWNQLSQSDSFVKWNDALSSLLYRVALVRNCAGVCKGTTNIIMFSRSTFGVPLPTASMYAIFRYM